MSAAEWRGLGRKIGAQSGAGPSFVPEFFGWLLDGAAPEQRARVLATLPLVMRPLATGVFRPMHARRAHWQTPEAGKLCAIRLIRPDDGFSCHFPAIFSL